MDASFDLRELQLAILDIFKEIEKICITHDIQYFLIGGTLLGAVRHKGFIPWDDDLDIGMTRENYDKFLKIATDELPDNLFLQTYETEPNTPFDFAKVRKNGTVFIENYCRNLDIHQGIYVDIFPYNNIPDDIKLRKKQHLMVQLWSNLFIAKSLTGSSIPQKTVIGKIKVLIRYVLHYLLKPISKDFLFNNLESAYQKYNDKKCEAKSIIKLPSFKVSNEDIINLEQVEFEGLLCSCPRDPKKQLKKQYGDFMKLPPLEDRVGHRPYKVRL